MPDPNLNYTGLATPLSGNVDRSILSLTGVSQALFAANPRRKRIIIKNGATALGLNLTGGTAVIGGAGTITLLAYEGIVFSEDDCPKNAMTVIGPALNYVSAFEGF